MLGNIRRIVTGHDKDGRSVVLLNEPPAKLRSLGNGAIGDAWITESLPADNSVFNDLCPTWPQLSPPKGGMRIAWFALGKDDPKHGLGGGSGDTMIIRDDLSRHPSMHRTNTLDYVVLIKGRMRMLLDKGEVDLNPGDVVIQRGTNHAWTNLYDEPAVLLSVMIDAVPGIGQNEKLQGTEPVPADSPFKDLKRVITGHDAEGKAVVLYAGPPFNRGEIWHTDSLPADLTDTRDLTYRKLSLDPHDNGLNVRWGWTYPQDTTKSPAELAKAMEERFAAMGNSHMLVKSARHPGMHKTDTVDYLCLLKGSLTLLLDEGEVTMNPGDVVIQRGTSHSWVNRGKEPALVMAVMADAKPLA